MGMLVARVNLQLAPHRLARHRAGIVDAAKVTRSALQNAASIAAMVLTTETLITDLPEKEKAGAGGGHDHGGGGGMDF